MLRSISARRIQTEGQDICEKTVLNRSIEHLHVNQGYLRETAQILRENIAKSEHEMDK